MASITSQAKIKEGLQPIASELMATSKGQVSNQGMHIPDLDMLDGKNIMPTLNGYTSFFGKNQQIGADDVGSDVQDVLSYRTFSGNTLLLALVRDGIFVKSLAGDGVATVTDTATEINIELFQNEFMSWTRVLTTAPASPWEIWTHCIIRNKLYLYQKGLGFLLRLDSIIFGEFNLSKLNPSYVIGTGQKNLITINGEEGLNEGTYKEFEYLVNGSSYGKYRIKIDTSTQAYSAPEQWEEILSISNLFSVRANITTRTKQNWENSFRALGLVTNTGGRYPTLKRDLTFEGYVDGPTSELNVTSYLTTETVPSPEDSPEATFWRKMDITIDFDSWASANIEFQTALSGFPFYLTQFTIAWAGGATRQQKLDAIIQGFTNYFNDPIADNRILVNLTPEQDGAIRIIFYWGDSDATAPFDIGFKILETVSIDSCESDDAGTDTNGVNLSIVNTPLIFDHDYMSYMGPYNVHFTDEGTEVLTAGTLITFSMAGWSTSVTSDGITEAADLIRDAAVALAQETDNDLEVLYDDGSVAAINFDNPNFDPISVSTSHWYLDAAGIDHRSFGVAARIEGGVVTGTLPAAAWDYTSEPINFYNFLSFNANGFNTGDSTYVQFTATDITDPDNPFVADTPYTALLNSIEMDVQINDIWGDPSFSPDTGFQLAVDVAYTVDLGIALFDATDIPTTSLDTDATSLFTVDPITTVPEPLPQVEGIFSARDRLGAWTNQNKIHWSSAVDVTDFTPSKTTQANELSVNAVQGHTVFCKGYDNGFVMYNTGNLVVGGYKGGQFVFDFKAIEQSSGCIDPRHIAGNLSAHYYWSELGLQVVQPADMEAKVIDPSLTDWLNKYRFPLTIRLVSNRFLVIELQYSPDTFDYRQAREETTPNALQEGRVGKPFVGQPQVQLPSILFGRNLYPTYKRALVFDILLSKWGTCDKEHKVLYSLNPMNQQGFPIEKDYYLRDSALHNELRGLAILDPDGDSWLADTKVDDSYCLFGKYAVHRYRETKLVELFAEFVNVPFNTQAQIERTIDEQEIYDITSDTRTDGIHNRLDHNLAGNWFNLLIRGEDYHLKRLMARGYAYGR